MSRNRDSNEQLSRKLVKVLRHDATRLGLLIQTDGYVLISDLLNLDQFRRYTESDIISAVSGNKRFTVTTSGRRKIKANQAHSIEVPDLDMEEIRNPRLYPELIHLTTETAWSGIRREGLKSMTRTHIHLSPSEDKIYQTKVPACKVRIYIDTSLAMAGGIKFFLSPNGDILSPGNQDGIIPKKYFSHVELREGRTVTPLSF